MTFSFPSRRSVVRAARGVVATSQPLAATAGLEILRQGGNAVDAAVATAAVLNVVEPMSTGIGGDMFALVWSARDKQLYALNGSGRCPAGLTIEEIRKLGVRESIPPNSWLSVTIPGTVDGWATLLDRFGTLSLAQVLAPAIHYAKAGFPVSEVIARAWHFAQPKLEKDPSAARVYLPNARAPRVGEIHRQPELAESLQMISREGRDAFYFGEIADRIVEHAQSTGGYITHADLQNHTSTWDEPISTRFRDVTVYECPPNGQGVIALNALNILEGFDLAAMGFGSAEYLHLIVEALRLAFSDGLAHIADPRVVPVPTDRMLDKGYAVERRALINPLWAMPSVTTGIAQTGDTVYLSVVDQERNCVSFINSLYESFGSGIVVPGTGICLQNRGTLFSLDPRSPNALAPGKRPYHTIIPAMAFRDGAPWLVFGVMGGFMQPQGHVQVLLNMIDWQMDPQVALDAPRVRIYDDGSIAVEDAINNDVRMALAARGHRLIPGDPADFGGGQIIMLDAPTGGLAAGSDPRKDGCAVGY